MQTAKRARNPYAIGISQRGTNAFSRIIDRMEELREERADKRRKGAKPITLPKLRFLQD